MLSSWLIAGVIGWALLCYQHKSKMRGHAVASYIRGFLFALLLGPITIGLFVWRAFHRRKKSN